MSRHQDIRNLDFQNELDDAYGYSEEEDELSPEDRAQMRQATIEVKAALGLEASKVTTAQIEEALWYYYYDVDKSVGYLVSKFVAPAPKAAKTTQSTKGKPSFSLSRLGLSEELCSKRQVNSSRSTFLAGTSLTCCQGAGLHPPQGFKDFFWDMPWGRAPKGRQTVFIAPPRAPGGLLGGSPDENQKTSKLLQLAATRKRKLEEKKMQGKTEQAREKISELSLVDPNTSMPSRITLGKRIKASAPGYENLSPTSTNDQSHYGPSAQPTSFDNVKDTAENREEFSSQNLATPSTFARALLAPSSRTLPQKDVFSLPYLALSSSLDVFSRPSPDDIVLAAQAQAGKKATTASSGTAPKVLNGPVEAVSNDVKGLMIEEALPKSKNLDILSEYERAKSKKTASFVVVGHVDAGKSTMMGRLLLDLNVVDQRTVDKLRREAEKIGKSSFALAWVLDQRTEERARGVTIDIATNRFETDTTTFTVLDAPGHRDFIPNMIAGASQADFAILVIDASTGAFESGLKGQTKEHSLLIRSMGVSRIIVAVNKLDTVHWSEERFEEIKNQATGFLTAKTLGFQEKNIVFVPVSGLQGDNLVYKSTNPAASWYSGPTLVEELEKSEPSARALSKPLRMTISEVFRSSQNPLSVSGRIDAGSLQAGDSLLVQPSGEKAYVKGLQHDDQPVDWAVAGQNVVIHLTNIDPIHVRVGDIVCDPAQPVECLDRFTLKALAFNFLMPMQVDVHRGRLHAAGKIEELSALLDKVNGSITKKRPKIAKPGNTVRLVVKMDTKVPLEAGQRVILRSGGETIAAGLLE